MSSQPTPLRVMRERDLVKATRALFDERGLMEAPIEEIAKAVGIARGLVYRHFSSKEELYVLTVTDYLQELEELLARAHTGAPGPAVALERLMEVFADYGCRHPAFVDSSLRLMQRPARELFGVISDSVWLRLGQGMAACLDHVIRVLRAGMQDGSFRVGDPDYEASVLWTQALGTLHLSRVGVGVRQAAPGVPELFTIEKERVVRSCVRGALACAGVTAPA
jgi:AcrR family transcriptional regulator